MQIAMAEKIPIHEFLNADNSNAPFRYVPLNARSDYDISLAHRHNYYEIFFFSKGGGWHLIDFDKFTISDHSIHFVCPGQVHLVKREPSSYGSILIFTNDLFHLGAETKNTLLNFPFLNNGVTPKLDLTAQEFEGFNGLLKQIETESTNHSVLHPEIIRSYLHIILLKCMQLYDEKNPGWQQKRPSLFYEFRMLMEREYRQQKLPAYYAQKLNITEKKLNKLCTDAVGHTVGEYIKERVLLEAKRLIGNTDFSIKEIAYFLGYEDVSYFIRFFKNKTGTTAGDFRKQWHKEF